MKRNLALALSGGGIKAYCEIGVVKVFEENGIAFEGFAGTSMGSIIAAFLATGMNADTLKETMLDLERDIIKDKLFKTTNLELLPLVLKQTDGFLKNDAFQAKLKTRFDAMGIVKLTDLPLPFVCVAVDLVSAKPVLFTNEPKEFEKAKQYIIVSDVPLVEALTASCSFPLVFNTVKMDNMQLVDGGVMMNIPVAPLKTMGFDKVVSVSMQDISEFKETSSLRDVAARIIDISMHESENWMIASSDLNINVKSKNIGVFSMGKGNLMIDKGYKTAQKMFDQITNIKLQKKRFWF